MQVWTRSGRLPQDVEALAGGFTDAALACHIGEDAAQEHTLNGLADLWRYQGFKL